MPRTTTQAVKTLLARDYDGQTDLTQHVDVAGIWVDRVVASGASAGKPVSARVAEMLERWLAAHSYQQADPGYVSKSTGRASGSFKGEKGSGFASTNYGATAIRLDPTGSLASIDAGVEVVAFWAGKTEAEQRPYWE